MRTWRLDLDSDEHAGRLARHTLRTWLDLVACSDDAKADVTIVVSELVTDAVTSGTTHISVRMLFDDGRLRIDVHGQEPRTDGVTSSNVHSDATRESLTTSVLTAAADAWEQHGTPQETHAWAELLC